MSDSLKNKIVSQPNDRDEFYQGGNNNNNNNDNSFVSINYARPDEPVGDMNPLRRIEDAHTSVISYSNNTQNASLKALKRNYHLRKKYFTKNIQSAIDSTQEIHSGWLKARTTFKRWTKTWCQVKPGYMILYTSQEAQKKHRLGVVLLSVCQVIKRPTKKDGFCFKLINPFGCSVWAKSSTKAIVFAQASLTLRVLDDSIGKLWLDALHRCHLSSNLEGYQPIVDSDDMFARGSGANSRLGDTGESSGDDQSTRQLESMLNHSSSMSDSNSLLSSQRNTNFRSEFINGQTVVNGSVPSGNVSSVMQSKSFKSNVHSYEAGKRQGKDLLTTTREIDDGVQPPSQQRQPHDCRLSDGKNVECTANQVAQNSVATIKEGSTGSAITLNYSKMVGKFSRYSWKELQLENVDYKEDGLEELGSAGMQSEEVHESNKNFLWHIIKQLRPGMDLSKVTLPTFILEPRSFLEKLADYYYHCDILSEAVQVDDPVLRLITIVKWYLSGFYKKPKGPKKPYNPILGERFRCFWDHPKTKSRTFFVAEQVSHHPPISAFHVTNRKEGYTITCALLSRSKYSGNSVSAILDGKARLYLNKRNETYTITMPYANCRGILLGSLCMELGGKVEIECARTGCKCELDFKLASMWASQSSYNALIGKILRRNEVTHTIEGHWDKKINIIDKLTENKSVLWEVTDSVRSSRLKRYTVSLKDQDDRESVKLWSRVTEALIAGNQTAATAEKTRLEDMQRKEARERSGQFLAQHFQQALPGHGEWSYKWQDDRPWDDRRDIMQFEENFKVRTLMLSPTYPNSGHTISKNDNDLPLTQLGRLASQIQGLAEAVATQKASPIAAEGSAIAATKSTSDISEETIRTIESRIAAGNIHVERVLKQVTEKNRKLEEDIALLKRARGKRTLALLMTAITIVLISAVYRLLS